MIAETVLLRVAWSATYTYILLLFAAAAFVAYISRPRQRGEVVKRLFAGTLIDNPAAAQGSAPYVHVRCLDNSKVLFERFNVENLTSSGAVSLAVTFNGRNVEIVERDTPGYSADAPVYGAQFVIDMSGAEWRHIKWTADDSDLWCAFSLHVREGIDITVPLKH